MTADGLATIAELLADEALSITADDKVRGVIDVIQAPRAGLEPATLGLENLSSVADELLVA